MFSVVVESSARIACIYVADFAVAIALRALGEEPEEGLAVGAERPEGPVLTAVSRGARLDGARSGMTCAEALALAPEVLIIEQDSLDLRAVQRELERVVREVCPELHSGHKGILYVHFNGMERRYQAPGISAADRELGFLQDLQLAVQPLELPVRVGMAGSRFAARAAAILQPSSESGVLMGSPGDLPRVCPGRDREFLAPLPLSLLPEAVSERHLLQRLGLATLGELADLHSASLRRRLGSRGLDLQSLARGLEPGPGCRTVAPSRFYQRCHCDYPVSSSAALLLSLRQALLTILETLAGEGLAAMRLQWFLELQGSSRQGSVAAGSRSGSSALWLRLLGRAMEQVELSGPVHAVSLEALEIGPLEHTQRELPGPRSVAPEAVQQTLEQLATELTARSFGRSLVRAAVWPEDRQSLSPFACGRPGRSGASKEEGIELADSCRPGQLPCAFRRVLPAEPVAIELRNGRPQRLRWRDSSLAVEHCLGPWEVSSGWWQGPACRRRYFQLQAPGFLAQVYSRLPQGDWFLSGWWD